MIDNEIGKIFLGHNLLEYKSPLYQLNVNTYFKVLGYACFYKSFGETQDGMRQDISEDDITLSFIREGYPRELMNYFRSHDYAVEQKYPGIYYVTGDRFPIQIIVSGELNQELHLWLTSLTRNMKEAQAENLVSTMSRLPSEADRKYANSVLDLAMRANPNLFNKVKEENPVCEALLELMKPEMDAAIEKNTDSVKTQAVDNILKIYGGSLETACQTIGISLEKYREVRAALLQKAEEVPA